MVAVLAHALALIERDILGGTADPDRCATAALFHDASEILTGDLPTPIKYFNPEIKKAYKQVEAVSCEKLLGLLPQELQKSYEPLLFESDEKVGVIVKAADQALGVFEMRRGAEGGQYGVHAGGKADLSGACGYEAAVPRLLHGALPGQLPADARRALKRRKTETRAGIACARLRLQSLLENPGCRAEIFGAGFRLQHGLPLLLGHEAAAGRPDDVRCIAQRRVQRLGRETCPHTHAPAGHSCGNLRRQTAR